MIWQYIAHFLLMVEVVPGSHRASFHPPPLNILVKPLLRPDDCLTEQPDGLLGRVHLPLQCVYATRGDCCKRLTEGIRYTGLIMLDTYSVCDVWFEREESSSRSLSLCVIFPLPFTMMRWCMAAQDQATIIRDYVVLLLLILYVLCIEAIVDRQWQQKRDSPTVRPLLKTAMTSRADFRQLLTPFSSPFWVQ